jgi:hypothetical protein
LLLVTTWAKAEDPPKASAVQAVAEIKRRWKTDLLVGMGLHPECSEGEGWELTCGRSQGCIRRIGKPVGGLSACLQSGVKHVLSCTLNAKLTPI